MVHEAQFLDLVLGSVSSKKISAFIVQQAYEIQALLLSNKTTFSN